MIKKERVIDLTDIGRNNTMPVVRELRSLSDSPPTQADDINFVNELQYVVALEIAQLKEQMNELKRFVYPGPLPRDKEMRRIYLKVVKEHYKRDKGVDVDVSHLE